MPAIDPQWIWIGAAVVAVLIVIALLLSATRRSRTARLRDAFGAEYDHLTDELGRRRAEEELGTRLAEARTITSRPLTVADRERFLGEWGRIEKHFVERPAMAVSEADELIDQILRAEGYPGGDYRRHLAHLSMRQPRLAEHYRGGHGVISDHEPGRTTTEELRQAMLHFRELIDDLLGPTDVARDVPVHPEVPVATETGLAATTARERVRAQEAADRSSEDIVR